MFKRRICKRLNAKILIGGHEDAVSIVQDNILWKNAQKNNIKKILRKNDLS